LLKHQCRLAEEFVGSIRCGSTRLTTAELHLVVEGSKASATMLAVNPLPEQIHANLQLPATDWAMLLVVNISVHGASLTSSQEGILSLNSSQPTPARDPSLCDSPRSGNQQLHEILASGTTFFIGWRSHFPRPRERIH
jgi:hypothetical protein